MITRTNYEIWMLDYAEGKLNPAQQKLFMAFLEENPDLKKELEAFENIPLPESEKEKLPRLHLRKKQSWLLEKYSTDELVFHYNEGNLNAEELREWNDLVRTMPQLLLQAEKEKQLVLKPRAEETFGEKVLLKRAEGIYELTTANYKEYFIQYHETHELALHMAIKGFLARHPQLKKEFEQYGQLVLKADTSIVYEQKEELKKKEKVVALYWWRYAAAAASLILAVWLFYPADTTTIPMASHSGDSIENKNQALPPQNNVSPGDVMAREEGLPKNKQHDNEENVSQQDPHLAVQPGEQKKQQKKEPVLQEVDRNPAQLAEEKKKQQEKPNQANQDSVVSPVPVQPLEKEDLPVASVNKEKKGPGHDNIQTVETPTELVSAVLNKKYYSAQTPRQETGNAFYAMRNVVHTVSGGEADVSKKEDKNTKEFSIRIGNFGFSRKKQKDKDE